MDTLYNLNQMRTIVLALPGTEAYTCFGTPAFRVKRKLLARLREDGETVAIHADDRDIWLKAEPEVFFITDHYYNYPTLLLRLDKVSATTLQKVLTEAWEQIAPKRLVADYLQNNNQL